MNPKPSKPKRNLLNPQSPDRGDSARLQDLRQLCPAAREGLGALKGSFEGTLKGTLKGSFKGSLKGSFEGTLKGTLKGSFKGSL